MRLKTGIFLFLLALISFALPVHATISTLQSQVTLSGNGATTQFSFPFVADSSNDIALILTSSAGAQTTIPPSQYSVAINPPATGQLWGVGGFITYPLTGSPIASGNTLTIQRVLPLNQQTSLQNQGNYAPTVIEQALDTNVMQTQQISARTGSIRGTWVSGTQYNYGDIVQDGVNGNDTANLYLAAIANTSSVWTTDLANGDWILALNIQGIVNAAPTINNNSLVGNISGIPATGYGIGASAFLDSVFGNAQGDILYRSGSAWNVLPPGTNGQVLETQGASANPIWASASGSGTVTSVTCGTGLSGGTFTSSGTCAFAGIASNSLLANTTTGTSPASATTLSAYLDTVLGNTQGSIIYRGGSTWQELGPGSNGQYLQTQGAGANPQWVSAPGSNSALTLVTTASASSGQSLSISSTYLTSAYHEYILYVDKVANTGNFAPFQLELSANNCSSYLGNISFNTVGTNAESKTGQSAIDLDGGAGGSGNFTTYGGRIDLVNPSASGNYPTAIYQMAGSVGSFVGVSGQAVNLGSSAVNCVTFYSNAGSTAFSSINVRVYGVQ